MNPDHLRQDKDAVDFMKALVTSRKPVAAFLTRVVVFGVG